MAKRVYFAFHYQDVIDFRANVVRNSWVTHPDRQAAGFFDASIWETARRTSDLALKRLINHELENTSVTAVLIGSETFLRRWVRYEIIRSMAKGNTLLGVHINGIAGKDGRTKQNGPCPFEYLSYHRSPNGTHIKLMEFWDGAWTAYGDHESYATEQAGPPHERNSFVRLAQLYNVNVYDWIADDGYSNFAQWVAV